MSRLDWSKPVWAVIQMTGWRVPVRRLWFKSMHELHERLEANGWWRDHWGALQKYSPAYVAVGVDKAIRGHFRLCSVEQARQRDNPRRRGFFLVSNIEQMVAAGE